MESRPEPPTSARWRWLAAVVLGLAAVGVVFLGWLATATDTPDGRSGSAAVIPRDPPLDLPQPGFDALPFQGQLPDAAPFAGAAEDLVAEGDQVPTGLIVGRVVDPLGHAVEDATVELWLEAAIPGLVLPTKQFAATRSAADGRFEIRAVSCLARHLLHCHLGDRDAPSIADVTPLPGESLDVGDLVLLEPGRIEGSVRDSEGAAVPGARITVLTPRAARPADDGSPTATVAAADGTYALAGIPAGDCAVLAEASGLATSLRSDVTIEPLAAVRCDFVLGAASTISGTVIGTAGAPPADATVQALGFDPVTGSALGLAATVDPASGSFVVRGVPAGTYRVRARAPDFATTSVWNVAAGTSNVQVQMPEKGGLRIAAGDASGQPVASFDAWIRTAPAAAARGGIPDGQSWKRVVADESHPGEVRIRPLVAGRYLVVAQSSSLGMSPLTAVEIRDGSTTDALVSFQPVRSVTGRVLDGTSRAPLAGARIEASETVVFPRGTCFTGADGSFELRGLPAEGVTLGISLRGYSPLEVDVGAWEVEGLDVLLARTGTLRVTLSPKFIADYAGPFDVVLTRPDGGGGLLEELEGDELVLGLGAGAWIISVEPSDEGDEGDASPPLHEESIEIRPGEVTVIEVG